MCPSEDENSTDSGTEISVAGKLAGYTWNLTDEYAFAVDVTEIGDKTMQTWRFAARTRFEREAVGGPRPFTGVVFADPVVTVEAAPLDHKIVSMAYAISERTHLNVRTDVLAARGLRPGPWLSQLKAAIRAGDDDIAIALDDGASAPAGELRRDFVIERAGQKIAYVVDTRFDLEDNLLMFFTGFSRSAGSILKSQKDRTHSQDAAMLANLHYVKELGLRSRDLLVAGRTADFGALMHEHWEHKKRRSRDTTTSRSKVSIRPSLSAARMSSLTG